MKISEKGKRRYDSVMNAGLELFLKNGFEKTSLNDIVAKGGGSLASIYKFFTNKEGLFASIMEQNFNEFFAELDEKMNLKTAENLEQMFYNFALNYFEVFCKPRALALTRLVISECYKNKKLGEYFEENVGSKMCGILINYLNKAEISAQIKDYDRERLVFKFCALVREPFHLRAIILGQDIKFSKKEKEELAKQSVDIFLHGICK